MTGSTRMREVKSAGYSVAAKALHRISVYQIVRKRVRGKREEKIEESNRLTAYVPRCTTKRMSDQDQLSSRPTRTFVLGRKPELKTSFLYFCWDAGKVNWQAR